MSDEDSSSSSCDETIYDEIQEYFSATEWGALSKIEKRAYLNQKLRHDHCATKGLPLKVPSFMKPKANLEKGSGKRKVGKENRKPRSTKRRKEDTGDDDSGSRTQRKSSRNVNKTPVKEPMIPNVLDADDIFFSGIKPYFDDTQWNRLPPLSKRHALKAKESYDAAVEAGLSPALPKFMQGGIKQLEQQEKTTNANVDSEDVDQGESSSEHPGVIIFPDNDDDDSEFDSVKPYFTPVEWKKLPLLSKLDAVSELEKYERFKKKGLAWPKPQFMTRKDGRETASRVDLSLPSPNDDAGSSAAPSNIISLDQTTPKHRSIASLEKNMPEMDLNSNSEDSSGCDEAVEVPARVLNHKGQQKPSKKKKVSVPLLRQRQVEPEQTERPRPDLASKTLSTDALGYVIIWADMRDTLLECLEKKKVPSTSDRSNMVQIISSTIKELHDEARDSNPTMKQKTPGRSVYKAVVTAIFREFRDSFEDRVPLKVGYKVIGDGQFTLQDQIETCVENKYRAMASKGSKSVVSKGNRRAACIIPEFYGPSMSKKDKQDAQLTCLELKAMYQERSSNWDWTLILKKMLSSPALGAQRSMINSRDRNMHDMMQNWPFLFEMRGLLAHLDKITGASLMENFNSFVVDELDEVIQFMTISSPERIPNLKIKRNIDSGNRSVAAKMLGAVLMIANHFSEDATKIIVFKVEDGTLPHEIPDTVENLPASPSLVAFGNSVFSATEFSICMDGACICTGLSGLEAVVTLLASYFVFGNLYPPEISTTLTFIERRMANLHDSDGVVRAATSKGGVCNSSLKKVLSLVKAIAAFTKEMCGSDESDL